MPYLANFETDLFLSYGHLDNSAAVVDDQRWIDRFHRDLESRVSQYLGSSVTAWRDNHLRGNEVFSEEIETKVQHAGALIPVVSPRYLKSDWCQREFSAFVRAVEHSGGMKIGTKSRVFKVIKTLVDLKEQPAIMRNVLGYEFYVLDDKGRPKELPDWDPAPDAEKRYLTRVDDLAYDLHLLLKDLKASEIERDTKGHPEHDTDHNTEHNTEHNQQAVPSLASSPTPRRIYLAETTRELADTRDQIRRELLAFGFEVVPDQPLPDEAKELKDKVSNWLDSCCLSLHLIGARYGLVPEGDEETRSTIWLQQQLAAERHSKDFQCVLWIAPGTEVTDGRQQGFLQSLQAQLETESRFELLKTPLQELKNFVFDRLKPAPESRDISPVAAMRLYLMCEKRDSAAIAPIRDALNQRGIQVDLPLWDGDQTDIRQDHEAILQDCDGVLIYYGAASEAWVREKIRDLRRARGLGRSRPFAIQSIYIGPEETEAKKLYSNLELVVVRNFATFAPVFLNPIVDGIVGGKAASA